MDIVGKHSGLSKQEQKVLDWLSEGFKNLDGRILVEPGFRRKRYQEWPDFLVISPTHGVLIIECKGHYSEEIKQVSNVDLLTTRGVVRYGKQLASYGCLIRDLLSTTDIPISKFVVFPEILSTDPVATYINEFNTRFDDVRVFYHESLDWPCSMDYMGVRPMGQSLRKGELSELFDLLNPTRVIEHNYTADTESTKNLKLLDEQQMSYLDLMQEGHYLLNGLPGTGKTIMLMKLAEREASKDKKVMYTCYNNPLGKYVAGEIGDDIARTTHSLYAKHVKLLGHDFSQDPDWKEKTLSFLLEKSFEPYYDVLLIDEYQDLEDEDYNILMKFIKPEGLLVLAGDRLQNIRGSKETWKSKGIKITGRSKFLKYPYRTSPQVVDFALKFLCTNSYLEKEAAKYFDENEFNFESMPFEDLQSKIKFRISTENEFDLEVGNLKTSFPDAKILIITPHQGQQRELSFLESKNLKVETYLRAKGLEADVVILYNIDSYQSYKNKYIDLKEELKMRSIFSALCRSRSDVYIHGLEAKDYFATLKDIYHSCLKKKAA